jgi:hypothetical protein
MNTKHILGFMVFVFMSVTANAQTYIQFTYDLNGNRQTRQVLVMQLKSSKISFPITDLGVLEEKEVELSDNNEVTGVSVYPNPASEAVVIKILGTMQNSPAEARLYDLNGDLLKQKVTKDQLLELDLTALKDGIYILIIRIDDFTSTHKIIKGQGN